MSPGRRVPFTAQFQEAPNPRKPDAAPPAPAPPAPAPPTLPRRCHEVRTPLNGCLASAEMLLETPLAEEQRELANTIRVSGSILLSTVRGGGAGPCWASVAAWAAAAAAAVAAAAAAAAEGPVPRGGADGRARRRSDLWHPHSLAPTSLAPTPQPPRSPTSSTFSSWRPASASTRCAPRSCCPTSSATCTASSRRWSAAAARSRCCRRTCPRRRRRRCCATPTGSAACC
jgi:hypothetical protein